MCRDTDNTVSHSCSSALTPWMHSSPPRPYLPCTSPLPRDFCLLPCSAKKEVTRAQSFARPLSLRLSPSCVRVQNCLLRSPHSAHASGLHDMAQVKPASSPLSPVDLIAESARCKTQEGEPVRRLPPGNFTSFEMLNSIPRKIEPDSCVALDGRPAPVHLWHQNKGLGNMNATTTHVQVRLDAIIVLWNENGFLSRDSYCSTQQLCNCPVNPPLSDGATPDPLGRLPTATLAAS